MFRTAIVLTAAPIVIAAVRNGLAGWYPTNDAALTTVYVKDVFSAHTPLIGLPARNSFGPGLDYFYPGALEFYLLAVPVKLLGITWGLLTGMAILNTAWITTALWLVRRRVGYRVGIFACAAFASLLWGLGSQVLMDPTPVQTGSLAFLTLCVAAWSVADGDHKALVPLALAGNFLVLTHLKFIITVPLIGVVALAMWLRCVVRQRRSGQPNGSPGHRGQRRALIVAVGISALLWIPTIVQQLFSSRGNLSALIDVERSGGDAVSRSFLDTIRVVSTPVVTWPLWFRDSLAHPHFSTAGPTSSPPLQLAGAIVVIAVALAVGISAWRRRDATVGTALAIGSTAWVGWVVSTQLNPVSTHYERTYLQVLWPLALFIWLAMGIGVIRSSRVARLRHSGVLATATPALGIALIVVFAVLNMPIHNSGATTSQHDIPIARKVRRAVLDHVNPPGPVLVGAQSYPARAYFPVVLLALQEQGIPFRVAPGWDSTVYRSFRSFRMDPPNATTELIVSNSAVAPKGGRAILAVPRTTELSPAQFARISQDVAAWLSSVKTVTLPKDVDSTPEERRAFDLTMTWAVAAAHSGATQATVLALVASAVNLLPEESQQSALHVPRVDPTSMRRWLHDLVAQPTYIYMRPVPKQ